METFDLLVPCNDTHQTKISFFFTFDLFYFSFTIYIKRSYVLQVSKENETRTMKMSLLDGYFISQNDLMQL